jgi:hypothetical protein
MRPGIVTMLGFAVVALLLNTSSAQAKRRAPAPVTPVVHDGVRYTAPTERMGWVEARDQAKNGLLWEVQVYVVTYDPLEERDVQDIYIVELRVEGGDLAVKDERDRELLVDLATHKVRPR